MRRERRRVANAAATGLDAEIALRRAELAILERARDTIARDDVGCDKPDGTCTVVIHTALCRACGYVAHRCSAHGGARAATSSLRYHEHVEHGDGWSDAAATEDTGGMLRGAEAVRDRELPPSPALDSDRHGPLAPQPTDGRDQASESRTEGERRRGGYVR